MLEAGGKNSAARSAPPEKRPDRRTQAGTITKTKILDSAERLFSQHGADGVSVREIAADAKVDIAMINYHFKSKDGLYRQVFARRAQSLNELRLSELDTLLTKSRGKPSLHGVVHAAVAPNIRLRILPQLGGLPFARMIVREMIDADERARGVIDENFNHAMQRFVDALGLALPNATYEDRVWAFNFAVGTMVQAMASTGRLVAMFGSSYKFNAEEMLDRIVPFIVSGIKATVRRKPARSKGKTGI